MERSRECDGPYFEGQPCDGPTLDYQPCNEHVCPGRKHQQFLYLYFIHLFNLLYVIVSIVL